MLRQFVSQSIPSASYTVYTFSHGGKPQEIGIFLTHPNNCTLTNPSFWQGDMSHLDGSLKKRLILHMVPGSRLCPLETGSPGRDGEDIKITPHMVKPTERAETSEDPTDVCNQPSK